MGITGSDDTLVSKGTEVVGDIHFGGHLIIDGKVRGNIYADKDSSAFVEVKDKGLVEGEIRAPSVMVNGKVIGDVHSSKHLELAAKAVVEGNVHYSLIEMVKGAQVNGSLVYAGEGAKKPKTDKPSPAKTGPEAAAV